MLFILLRSGTAQGYATLLPKFYESVGCTVDPSGAKVLEREGTQLRELRYALSLPVRER